MRPRSFQSGSRTVKSPPSSGSSSKLTPGQSPTRSTGGGKQPGLGRPISTGSFGTKGQPTRTKTGSAGGVTTKAPPKNTGVKSRQDLNDLYKQSFETKQPRKLNRTLTPSTRSARPAGKVGGSISTKPESGKNDTKSGDSPFVSSRRNNGRTTDRTGPISSKPINKGGDDGRGGDGGRGDGGRGDGGRGDGGRGDDGRGGGRGDGNGDKHGGDRGDRGRGRGGHGDRYKYKYKYKYKYGRGRNGYRSWWDCWLWRINVHSYLGFHYYPTHYNWYSNWFGFHPAYSSYWWCEWWPYYSYYPSYVSYYPTYVGVPAESSSTIIYYPYYDAPGAETSYEDGYYPAPTGGDIPQDQVSPEFAAELDSLATNTNAIALMEEGARLFQEGDYPGAAEAFRMAVLAEKTNAVPKFAMAHALFALGEYEYAAFMIRRGMEILPSWPSVGADMRDLYGNPDDLMEQMIALQIYREAHPESADAAMLLGYMSFFSGDLDEAETQFSGVMALEENNTVGSSFLLRIGEIRTMLEEMGTPATDPTGNAPAAAAEAGPVPEGG